MFSVVPSEKSLPDELTLQVLKHLSWRDLAQVASVNRYMRRVSEDNTLWRPFFKTCFSELSLNEQDKAPGAVKKRFRAEFFKIQKKIKAFEGKRPDEALKRHYFDLLYQIEKEKEKGDCNLVLEKFNDDEVMMKALIKLSPLDIIIVNSRLKDDKAFALYAIERESLCWNYLSLRLKSDKDLINKIFDKRYFPLSVHVLAAYRNDLNTIRRAVSVSRKNLSKASVTVRRNKAFVMSLIKQYKDSAILLMADSSLWADFELQALILEFEPDYIKRCTYEFRNNKDLMLPIVKKRPSAYQYVGLKLRGDIDFLLALIQEDDQIFYRLQALSYGTVPYNFCVCDYIIKYKSLSKLQSIKILLDEGYSIVSDALFDNPPNIILESPETDTVITDKPPVWKDNLLVTPPETKVPQALAQRLDPSFWALKTAFNPLKIAESTTDAEDETTALSHSSSMLGGA